MAKGRAPPGQNRTAILPNQFSTLIRGRYAVAAMFLTNGFLMGCFALQIPFLLPRYQITESTVGLMLLALGLGAVGAMLFAGRVIARLGSRRAVILFALLACPSIMVIVLSQHIALATLGMVALGAFGGCMDVAMNANAVEVEKRLNRAIMSSSHGFWSLGGFIGSLGGGLVIARTSPETHAIAASLVALVVVLAASRYLIAEPPHPVLAAGEKHVHWPRNPGIYLIGLLALFAMIPEGAAMDWGALYLTRTFDASITTAGLGFAMFSGAMATMRFLGDAVRNRFGAVQTLRISALIGAAGVFGVSVAPTQGLVILCFFIAGIGIANTVPIAFSAAGNQPGISPGAGIAIATMMGYSGILVAPSAIGFAAEYIGYRITYFAVSLLLLVVALNAGRAGAADRIGEPAQPGSSAST